MCSNLSTLLLPIMISPFCIPVLKFCSKYFQILSSMIIWLLCCGTKRIRTLVIYSQILLHPPSSTKHTFGKSMRPSWRELRNFYRIFQDFLSIFFIQDCDNGRDEKNCSHFHCRDRGLTKYLLQSQVSNTPRKANYKYVDTPIRVLKR